MSGSRPPVVLIHGMGCDSRFWAPQLAALQAAGWEPCVADLPYHGGPVEGVGKSLPGLAAWVRRTCLTTPAILIGHSLGGMIALQIVHEAPAQVVGIVLVDAFADLRLSTAHLPGMFVEGGHDTVRSWVETTREGIVGRMTRAIYDEIWPSVRDFSAVPWLAEITCPLLGIYGGRDRHDQAAAPHLQHALQLDQPAGPTSVVVIPGAGHFVNLECPAEVNAALVSWLATQPWESS